MSQGRKACCSAGPACPGCVFGCKLGTPKVPTTVGVAAQSYHFASGSLLGERAGPWLQLPVISAQAGGLNLVHRKQVQEAPRQAGVLPPRVPPRVFMHEAVDVSSVAASHVAAELIGCSRDDCLLSVPAENTFAGHGSLGLCGLLCFLSPTWLWFSLSAASSCVSVGPPYRPSSLVSLFPIFPAIPSEQPLL